MFTLKIKTSGGQIGKYRKTKIELLLCLVVVLFSGVNDSTDYYEIFYTYYYLRGAKNRYRSF